MVISLFCMCGFNKQKRNPQLSIHHITSLAPCGPFYLPFQEPPARSKLILIISPLHFPYLCLEWGF